MLSHEEILVLAALCALGGRDFGEVHAYPRFCSSKYRKKVEKDKKPNVPCL